jgi:hypothetical protein
MGRLISYGGLEEKFEVSPRNRSLCNSPQTGVS